jgi:hypothetical protein
VAGDTLIVETAADYTEQFAKFIDMALPMDKRNKIDLRGLRVDDWVLIDGRPTQLRALGSKVLTDDGETFINNVKGIKLDDADFESVFTRLRRYDRRIQVSVRETSYNKYYLDLLKQPEDNDIIMIGKPLKYYHELQHALQDGGCILGLNYKWKQQDKEDAEGMGGGEKEASNA